MFIISISHLPPFPMFLVPQANLLVEYFGQQVIDFKEFKEPVPELLYVLFSSLDLQLLFFTATCFLYYHQ